MVSEASLLGPRDIVFGVTYDGRARATTEVLDYARTTQGATTICLTAVAGSPVTRVTDIALVVFGPKVPMGNAQFSARVSSMALLDAIATAVAVKMHGATVPTLQGFLDAQARINNVGPGWKPGRSRTEHTPGG
jgi:DNA-binding MurR/RpiR family transcriptional regulator